MSKQPFDVEAAEKAIRESCALLERTERPGVRRHGGTKTDALNAAKDAIIALLEKGYTAAQIADAIKNGNAGFAILPKTITMLAGKKPGPKKPKAPRKKSATKTGDNETTGFGGSVATPDRKPTNAGGFVLERNCYAMSSMFW